MQCQHAVLAQHSIPLATPILRGMILAVTLNTALHLLERWRRSTPLPCSPRSEGSRPSQQAAGGDMITPKFASRLRAFSA